VTPLEPVAPISLEPVVATSLGPLLAAAADAGLTVLSASSWPEASADDEVPPLAGFIESTFSPLLAEVAARALRRRPEPTVPAGVTAIVMVTALGDVTSATRVAAAVDAGQRVSPLLFFQSVPNAVAGYLAARWDLTGPVVCVSGMNAGLGIAALLIDDADADEALVISIDLALAGDGLDRAAALLVTRPEQNVPLTAWTSNGRQR
jgi:3-oxoacyl-(acyl-carrier-protein) synthase